MAGRATKKNGYVPLEIIWSDVPGRTEEWKQKTIAATSQKQFDQEFSCCNADALVTITDENDTEVSIRLGDLYDKLSTESLTSKENPDMIDVSSTEII